MTDASIILGIDGRPAQQGANVVKSSLQEVKTAAGQTKKAVESNTEAFEKLKQSTFGLRGAFQSLLAALSVREIIRYSDTWKQIEGRLALVTRSTAELRQVQQQLFDVSQRTRVSFEATATLYQRLSVQSKSLGLSNSELLRITEAVNQSFKISGTGASETSAAIRQLSQAFASGVLRGDEFNSVMENAPRLQQAIAESLGVTAGKLRTMAETGELTSKRVADAILKQGGVLAAEFAKIPLTVSDALTQVDNAFLKFIGQNKALSSGTSSLALALSSLAENFDLLAKSVILIGGVYATRFIPILYNAARAFVVNTAEVVRYNATLAAMMVRQSGAVGAFTVLGRSLGAMIPLFGIAAAAILLFGDNIDRAAETGSRFAGALKVIKDAMIDLGNYIGDNFLVLVDRVTLGLSYILEKTSLADKGFAKDVYDIQEQRRQQQQATAVAGETALEKASSGGPGAAAAATKEKTSALQKYNEKLKEALELVKAETAVSKVSDSERAAAKALIEAEAAAREDVHKGLRKSAQLRPAEIEFIKKTATETYKLTEALKKEDEGRQKIKDLLESTRTPAEKLAFELGELEKIKPLARTPEDLRAINREMERLRDEVNPLAEVFKNVATDIQQGFTDAFYKIFTGAKDSFSDIVGTIKDLFFRMLANLATIAIANPIIIPLVSGIGGALGLGSGAISAVTGQLGGTAAGAAGAADLASGGGSVLSGILNGFNTPVFGTYSTAESILGFFGQGSNLGAIGTLGDALSGLTPLAGIAGFGGNFLANSIFGNRGIGASIGGTIGGLGGSLAGGALLGGTLGAAAGPIGALAGSVLGNLVGGLFGGKPSDKTQVATVDLATGGIDYRDSSTGKKFSQENKDAATQFATIAAGLAKAIGDYTGEAIKKELSFVIGSRDGLRILDRSTGVQTNYGSNPGQLIKGIIDNLLSELTEVPKSLKTALDHIDFKDAEQALKDFSFALNFDNIDKKVEEVSQYKAAIDALNKQFDDAAETAKRLGLEESRVEVARKRQLDLIRTSFNTSINNQLLQLTNPSELARQQLEEEYKKNRLDATAVGGDFYAVDTLYFTKKRAIEIEAQQQAIQAQQDAIRVNVQLYNEQAQAAQNALNEWQRLSDALKSYADKLILNSSLSPLAPEQIVTEANRQFDSVLARALGGDKEAFNDLTGISDELLKASKDYYGATVPYFETFEKVKVGIAAAKAAADQGVNVAQAQLGIAQQQLSILQAQQDSLVAILNQLRAGAQQQAINPATTAFNDTVNAQILAAVSPYNASNGSGRGQISDFLVQNPQYIAEYVARRRQFSGQESYSLDPGGAAQQAGLFFNEQRYLQAYPDVANAVASGLYQSALQHYLTQGYKEHRRAFTYASGGLAQGWSLVGEQGPELVNFQNPTMVYPNEATRSILAANDNSEVVQQLRELNDRFDHYISQSAAETMTLKKELEQTRAENEETRVMLTRVATAP